MPFASPETVVLFAGGFPETSRPPQGAHGGLGTTAYEAIGDPPPEARHLRSTSVGA